MHSELQEKPPIDKQARTEARLRTAELEAQEKTKSRIDRAHLAAVRRLNQKTITVNGRMMAITRRQKEMLNDRDLDKIFDEPVSIDEDARTQVRVMNRESE